jgi:hypothetical protein
MAAMHPMHPMPAFDAFEQVDMGGTHYDIHGNQIESPVKVQGKGGKQGGQGGQFIVTPTEETPNFEARTACHENYKTPSGTVFTTSGSQSVEFWNGTTNMPTNMPGRAC